MIIDRFFEKISSRYPVANMKCQVTKTQPLRITVFNGRYMLKVGKSYAYLTGKEISSFIQQLEAAKKSGHGETDRITIDQDSDIAFIEIDKIVFSADAEELTYNLKSIAVAGGAI